MKSFTKVEKSGYVNDNYCYSMKIDEKEKFRILIFVKLKNMRRYGDIS